MNTIRRHWYNIGAVIALGVLAYVVISWQNLEILPKLLLLNFVALLIHQFEEYGWPGGFPAIMNMVLQPSSTPNCYPLNQNSAMIVNVLFAYPFYLIPVFFPHVIWLGLAPVLFGMSQFLVHGIVANVKLRSLYNPGMAAVVLLHVPIGILYISHIVSNQLATGWDWLFAVVYWVLCAGIGLGKVGFSWLKHENSPYPFSDSEMRRFHVEKKLSRSRLA
jgi:hypothetical protein